MIQDLCFEIIKRCVNNCKFCSSCSTIEGSNIIDYGSFKKTIEYIVKSEGLSEVSISGGEPMLHPQLTDMIKLCKSHNIKTILYTSGIVFNTINQELKDSDIAKYSEIEQHMIKQLKQQRFSAASKKQLYELKEAGLDTIVFDLQSVDCETYNSLMGTKNNSTNVMTTIIRAKSVGLNVEIHFIPMKQNYKEIDDILEICDIGEIDKLRILKFIPQGRGRENREDLELTQEQLEKFCVHVESIRNKYKTPIKLGIALRGENEHLCTAGLDKFDIRYDGAILPCVAFKDTAGMEIGNIKQDLSIIVYRGGSNKVPLCQRIHSGIQIKRE